MSWPRGFLWGTGASSTQCEGAAPASDWWDWERAGRAPLSGDGNGFAKRYAEDFRAARGARSHAPPALDRVGAARARARPARRERRRALPRRARRPRATPGVVPWVCLHHFTLPRWFAASGGFLVERNRTEHWRRHVDFVAETFGDLVGGWQPVNEMNFYAARRVPRRRLAAGPRRPRGVRARLRGDPPGHLRGGGATAPDRRAGRVDLRAHRRSSRRTTPPRPPRASRASARRNWDPGIGLFRDGVLRVPGRAPVERPDLAGAAST